MVKYFCTKNMWDNCSYRVAMSRFREKDIVLSRDLLDMSRITHVIHEKNTHQK